MNTRPRLQCDHPQYKLAADARDEGRWADMLAHTSAVLDDEPHNALAQFTTGRAWLELGPAETLNTKNRTIESMVPFHARWTVAHAVA